MRRVQATLGRLAVRGLLGAAGAASLAACTPGARGAPPEDHDTRAAAAAHNPPVANGVVPSLVDPAVLARMQDTVNAILARGVADSVFPGAVVAVGRRDGVVLFASAGRLDWAPSPAPDERTLWDIASLTKVVGTTTAIAQLVERGVVALDAPVQRYLPRWRHPGAEAVTVRHLLTHTSGLPPFRAFPMDIGPDSTRTLFYGVPLDTVPGAKLAYSDIGAFLLGEIVQAVTGLPLDRYLPLNVFGPLRMHETTFNPDSSLLHRVAPTERQEFRGGLVRGIVHDERAWRLGGVSAHAGLFSSAADLARFARMMLHEGALDGARVMRPETVRRFTAHADREYSNRGLGWQKPARGDMRFTGPSAAWAGTLAPDAAYGHTGFTGTSILVEPERDLFVILLTNRVNPSRDRQPARIGAVRATLADAIMSLVAPPPGASAPSPVSQPQ